MSSNGVQPMEGIADATSSSIGVTANPGAGSSSGNAAAAASTSNASTSNGAKGDAPAFADMTSKDYCASQLDG